jgi:hypothetical protein
MEKSTGKTFPQTRTGTKDVQRQASSEQLKQISQRNNYRGYDTKPQTAKRTTTQQRENRQTTPETGETGFTARAATRSPAAKQSAPGQCAERQRQPLRELAGAAAARCAKQTACCRQQQPRQASGGRAERREFDIAKGTDMKSKLLSGMVLFMLSASAMAQQSLARPTGNRCAGQRHQ